MDVEIVWDGMEILAIVVDVCRWLVQFGGPLERRSTSHSDGENTPRSDGTSFRVLFLQASCIPHSLTSR